MAETTEDIMGGWAGEIFELFGFGDAGEVSAAGAAVRRVASARGADQCEFTSLVAETAPYAMSLGLEWMAFLEIAGEYVGRFGIEAGPAGLIKGLTAAAQAVCDPESDLGGQVGQKLRPYGISGESRWEAQPYT